MNIPRPDPVPSRGVSDLDRHIETLLRVIHSRNLAWSDLSEVGKQVERPLTDVEQLLTNVGDDAHEITLATETIITALKLQRDALAIQSSRRRARFGSMLLLMIPVFFVGLMIAGAALVYPASSNLLPPCGDCFVLGARRHFSECVTVAQIPFVRSLVALPCEKLAGVVAENNRERLHIYSWLDSYW